MRSFTKSVPFAIILSITDITNDYHNISIILLSIFFSTCACVPQSLVLCHNISAIQSVVLAIRDCSQSPEEGWIAETL